MNALVGAVQALNNCTVYRGTLKQTGAGAPVLTQLENNTGLTFTPARTGAGNYTIALSAHPAMAKCFCRIGNSNGSNDTITTATYDNGLGAFIVITTYSASGAALADVELLNTPFEFRIYP